VVFVAPPIAVVITTVTEIDGARGLSRPTIIDHGAALAARSTGGGTHAHPTLGAHIGVILVGAAIAVAIFTVTQVGPRSRRSRLATVQ